MTTEELDRLEALANAATPGPWQSRWPDAGIESLRRSIEQLCECRCQLDNAGQHMSECHADEGYVTWEARR